MIPRRSLSLLALLLALAACGRYGTAYAAMVNGRPISFDVLEKAVVAARGSGEQARGPASIDVQRETLIQLIQRELIGEELKRFGITVTDADVTKRIGQLRALFGSQQEFVQWLAGQNLTEATLNDRMREQVEVERLQQKVVPVAVTEAEIRAAYQSQLGELTKAHVRHILISTQGSSDAAALAEAKDAVAKLRAGADFAALAKKLSDDPGSKDAGGDLGTQTASRYVAPFAKVVQTLKAQSISDPVKTEFGYHVIEVLSRTVTPLATARGELRSSIAQQKARAPFQQFIGRVLARAAIEVNPRIGDLDPQTFRIVDHRFFVPSSPETGGEPGTNPFGGANPLGAPAG